VGSVGNVVINATSKNASAKLISYKLHKVYFSGRLQTWKKVLSLVTGRKTILAVKTAEFVKD
jgi:hypothetical protein